MYAQLESLLRKRRSIPRNRRAIDRYSRITFTGPAAARTHWLVETMLSEESRGSCDEIGDQQGYIISARVTRLVRHAARGRSRVPGRCPTYRPFPVTYSQSISPLIDAYLVPEAPQGA
eukprot:712945-Prymnesium_polylepis.1